MRSVMKFRSIDASGSNLARRAAAFVLATLGLACAPAVAYQEAVADTCSGCRKPLKGHVAHGPFSKTVGFQGFGLGYHPGYGYGGKGLGVGQEGGYPFYGGPGYPQPSPPLNRFCGIAPFPFNPGPGGPTGNCVHYFGGVGPLFTDPAVIQIPAEPEEPDASYSFGGFTGMLPYDESAFAGATTAAASTPTAATPVVAAPAGASAGAPKPAADPLGIDYEAYSDGPERGIRITKLVPGGLAEKAGLRVGEVILSMNGYFTHTPELYAWILRNARPGEPIALQTRPSKSAASRNVTIPGR